MSRYSEYDDYDGEVDQILAQGRWERNARATLKSKRGRKVLADLREALMALPEHRLIEGALCTVGGADERAPLMTAEEMQQTAENCAGWMAEARVDLGADWPQRSAEIERDSRAEERERVAEIIESNGGEGVCAIGAYLWHQQVKAGADPGDALAALPTVAGLDGSDPLCETADLGKDAGLAYTLAWELAYRNDETFEHMTPEERWTAFVAWIDGELAQVAA
jgi:hypothetical protein